ncbi:hypothetical protein COCMIDRAFT_95503 [Bipolaris oryzae ATCC 44560]|uniref:Uncharacterized protein n=1 Tax=Bipolaris oryzae ATCC 44560 TaxID=930090 RepID=W6ZP83_COCMI|nr:uncharacterized protein COCMIDRAFT_95503 [Bipolaris oryzae ATCC 44560]EUC45421.1 hypothetical protein COCMIDRAFT_95503 [Bipolaris oryzae ATCC 44560]
MKQHWPFPPFLLPFVIALAFDVLVVFRCSSSPRSGRLSYGLIMAYYMMPTGTFPLLRCVPLYIPVSSKRDQEAPSQTSCSGETIPRWRTDPNQIPPPSSQSEKSNYKRDTQTSLRRFLGAMKSSKTIKQSSASSWHRVAHPPTSERSLIEPCSRDPRHASSAKHTEADAMVYDAKRFDQIVLPLHYHSHPESLQHQFLQVTCRPDDEKSDGFPPRYAALDPNPFSSTTKNSHDLPNTHKPVTKHKKSLKSTAKRMKMNVLKVIQDIPSVAKVAHAQMNKKINKSNRNTSGENIGLYGKLADREDELESKLTLGAKKKLQDVGGY